MKRKMFFALRVLLKIKTEFYHHYINTGHIALCKSLRDSLYIVIKRSVAVFSQLQTTRLQRINLSKILLQLLLPCAARSKQFQRSELDDMIIHIIYLLIDCTPVNINYYLHSRLTRARHRYQCENWNDVGRGACTAHINIRVHYDNYIRERARARTRVFRQPMTVIAAMTMTMTFVRNDLIEMVIVSGCFFRRARIRFFFLYIARVSITRYTNTAVLRDDKSRIYYETAAAPPLCSGREIITNLNYRRYGSHIYIRCGLFLFFCRG